MKIFLTIFFACATVLVAEEDKRWILNSDVCYDDLGCFTTRPPFSKSLARPVALLPNKPEEVATRFYLYTRTHPNRTRIAYNETSENFDVNRDTKFLIHGFLHNGFKKYIQNMKDALLNAEDLNVIVVDWSRKNGFPYTQATANTQIVGAEIARLVNTYGKTLGLNPDRVHIIGHSLGSHIAGYAGERIKGLGRISGLDPAGPYFENTDPRVRLDETDAKFVDVIHSDGSATVMIGLGLLQRLGHVDFYPNGGKEQPKCAAVTQKIISGIFNLVTVDVDGLEKTTGCSHMTAVYLFTDSISNTACKYISYPCNNEADFNEGKCLRCSSAGCNQMGYWASPTRDIGTLYLNTQDADNYPYCQHHYLITLNSNNLPSQTQTRGVFTVELQGTTDKSTEILVENSDYTLRHGASDKRLVSFTKHLGDKIVSLKLKFTKTSKLLSSWLYQNEWSFKNIEVTYGDNQFTEKFCSESQLIKSDSTVTFTPC